eukprot:GHVQ01037426.1.p1 GENE.GHVQ01037426.1~~GHVQ01037426.1.p1  ORF type:complete len:894 (-),score=150.18 GHVQ01037426.1:1191-3872(-)
MSSSDVTSGDGGIPPLVFTSLQEPPDAAALMPYWCGNNLVGMDVGDYLLYEYSQVSLHTNSPVAGSKQHLTTELQFPSAGTLYLSKMFIIWVPDAFSNVYHRKDSYPQSLEEAKTAALAIPILDWILNRLSKASPKIRLEYNCSQPGGVKSAAFCVVEFKARESMNHFSSQLSELRRLLTLTSAPKRPTADASATTRTDTLEEPQTELSQKRARLLSSASKDGAPSSTTSASEYASREAAAIAARNKDGAKQKALEKARLRRQEELLNQHHRKVLTEYHPELEDAYKHFVEDTGVLTDNEFWALHRSEDLPYRQLPVSVSNDAGFLIRPPVTENYITTVAASNISSSGSCVSGSGSNVGSNVGSNRRSGGSSSSAVGGSGGGSTHTTMSTDVNVTRDDLQRIIAEDKTLRNVYVSVVPVRMTEKDFWERFFQSKYFYEMIGKPAPSGTSNVSLRSLGGIRAEVDTPDDDASDRIGGLAELLQSHFLSDNETREGLARRQLLISPDIDLVKNDACRLPSGFGSVLGNNSMCGELADDGTVAQSSGNRSRMTVGTLPTDRKRHLRTLLQRFNNHSDKLLSGMSDRLNGDVLQLKLPSAETKGAGIDTESSPTAAQERRLRQAIEIDDLRSHPPDVYSTLGVTRQELFAHWTAAAQSSYKNVSQKGGGAPASPPSGEEKESEVETSRGEAGHTSSDQAKKLDNGWEPKRDAWTREVTEALLELSKEQAPRKPDDDSNKDEAREAGGMSLPRYVISRSMFVHNTKLCQDEKASQFGGGLIDCEADVVKDVSVRLERIRELLQQYYSSSIVQIEKRQKLLRAVDVVQRELEQAVLVSRSASTKSLYAPLVDMVKQVKQHAEKVAQFVSYVKSSAKAKAAALAAKRTTKPSASVPSNTT